jgi:putative membrane protein
MMGWGHAPAWVPALNTALIVLSGLSVSLGFWFIRRRRVRVHQWLMISGTVFAALFLVVYVTRALLFQTEIFAGEGAVRVLYLAILISHTVLAIVVGPLVLVTLYRAIRRDFRRHRRIARITLPIWLFVVASGWVIYLMLYQLTL